MSDKPSRWLIRELHRDHLPAARTAVQEIIGGVVVSDPQVSLVLIDPRMVMRVPPILVGIPALVDEAARRIQTKMLLFQDDNPLKVVTS